MKARKPCKPTDFLYGSRESLLDVLVARSRLEEVWTNKTQMFFLLIQAILICVPALNWRSIRLNIETFKRSCSLTEIGMGQSHSRCGTSFLMKTINRANFKIKKHVFTSSSCHATKATLRDHDPFVVVDLFVDGHTLVHATVGSRAGQAANERVPGGQVCVEKVEER